jgi:hypothetical protein
MGYNHLSVNNAKGGQRTKTLNRQVLRFERQEICVTGGIGLLGSSPYATCLMHGYQRFSLLILSINMPTFKTSRVDLFYNAPDSMSGDVTGVG